MKFLSFILLLCLALPSSLFAKKYARNLKFDPVEGIDIELGVQGHLSILAYFLGSLNSSDGTNYPLRGVGLFARESNTGLGLQFHLNEYFSSLGDKKNTDQDISQEYVDDFNQYVLRSLEITKDFQVYKAFFLDLSLGYFWGEQHEKTTFHDEPNNPVDFKLETLEQKQLIRASGISSSPSIKIKFRTRANIGLEFFITQPIYYDFKREDDSFFIPLPTWGAKVFFVL